MRKHLIAGNWKMYKTPKQAKAAAKISDGVIVASAIIDVIAKNKNVGRFVANLKKAIS